MTPPRERKPALDAEERTVTAPTTVLPNTELLSGTMLNREYKGRTVRVTVLADGFEFEGERYKLRNC